MSWTMLTTGGVGKGDLNVTVAVVFLPLVAVPLLVTQDIIIDLQVGKRRRMQSITVIDRSLGIDQYRPWSLVNTGHSHWSIQAMVTGH